MAPEPAHRILEDTERELPLKVAAVADVRAFECDTEAMTQSISLSIHIYIYIHVYV